MKGELSGGDRRASGLVEGTKGDVKLVTGDELNGNGGVMRLPLLLY